jgi:hypothetical protein
VSIEQGAGSIGKVIKRFSLNVTRVVIHYVIYAACSADGWERGRLGEAGGGLAEVFE